MSIRCILVDDSEEFLRSAADLLESTGFEIVGLARNADEALELVEVQAPDLALVDIELGDEDGVLLTELIVLRSPGTRVILVSAYEREDVRDAIASSSALGFIPKSRLHVDAVAELL
jgi:two-component system nitrate/nitrite response regulator NarL